MNNLRDLFRKYSAVVFFDTETSGLDYESHQIIELAAIRVEQTEDGDLKTAAQCDLFIKLPEGERIPERIVKLTGITDKMLENEGVTEAEAAETFTEMISNKEGAVLLVAHNAQFDLLFTRKLLRRHTIQGSALFDLADYIDTLTVFKDRRPYPHKLVNAITAYKLEDKVKNSHRAIDDVFALYEVCKAMDEERPDLHEYVNIFGFNSKYGVSGYRLDKVTYSPQFFNHSMQRSYFTLPGRLRIRRS
jgi:DNA polymerase-3 subunit epsilon